MDYKRLVQVLLQRLAPVHVATVLWAVTGYFAFMLGGVALSIILELTWPLLRPLFEVLYEELLAQRAGTGPAAQRAPQDLLSVSPGLHHGLDRLPSSLADGVCARGRSTTRHLHKQPVI